MRSRNHVSGVREVTYQGQRVIYIPHIKTLKLVLTCKLSFNGSQRLSCDATDATDSFSNRNTIWRFPVCWKNKHHQFVDKGFFCHVCCNSAFYKVTARWNPWQMPITWTCVKGSSCCYPSSTGNFTNRLTASQWDHDSVLAWQNAFMCSALCFFTILLRQMDKPSLRFHCLLCIVYVNVISFRRMTSQNESPPVSPRPRAETYCGAATRYCVVWLSHV